MTDNVFRFRRLKWAQPKRLPVLGDLQSGPRKHGRADPIAVLLWLVILVSLAVIGAYVITEVTAALNASGKAF